jgi:hypothetical protein
VKGGTSVRGWKRSGHRNPTVEDIVEESEPERADEDGDERTLVNEEVEKELEITDDECSDSDEKGGPTRKRTIRVIIRSRAFL